MADQIRIQMIESFAIYRNEVKMEQLVDKSRKGVMLLQILVLSRAQSVPNHRLMDTLWPDESSSNPESALKTLVSRMRALLNQIAPGLGRCIVSDRGAYLWKCQPGVSVDIYEIEDIFDALDRPGLPPEALSALNSRLLQLYRGDLLVNAEQNDWALPRATTLHNRYMTAVYAYLEALKASGDYDCIISVCHKALDVDRFDERLHMELMNALVHCDRNNEALEQYRHAMQLYYRYLGVRPSETIQEFYKRIVNGGRLLEFSIEAVREDLREDASAGAFVCEYVVFREICRLLVRNLERYDFAMCLGIIRISGANPRALDSIRQDDLMRDLIDVLRSGLRRGDAISLLRPDVVAVLMPMLRSPSVQRVMERIRAEFLRRHSGAGLIFEYRVGLLTDAESPGKAARRQAETAPEPDSPAD